MGYDSVANYIIAAIKRKAVRLMDTYPEASKLGCEHVDMLHYRQALVLLLDLAYYFFTLHPTVGSSLRLAHVIVRTGEHLFRYDDEGFEMVKEYILRWTKALAKSPTFDTVYQRRSIVPVELLNILVSLHQYSSDGTFEAELMEAAHRDKHDDGYFQVIIQLFIFRNHAVFNNHKDAVFEQSCKRILATSNLSTDSELTHLLLDLLACPYIKASKRENLLVAVWPKLTRDQSGPGIISRREARQVVSEIEQQHWFVRWDGIELLNMIEKKELSTVYA